MSLKGMIGLIVGLATACLLLAGSILYMGKTGDGVVAVPVLLYGVLAVHFLARIGSRRHLWYVQHWHRLIRFVCVAGPIAVVLGGLRSEMLGLQWLLLLLAVAAASAGMWVALTDRLKPEGEAGAV